MPSHTTGEPSPPPPTVRERAARSLIPDYARPSRVTVHVAGADVDAFEIADRPGACAACRSPLADHDAARLRACAATLEDTL